MLKEFIIKDLQKGVYGGIVKTAESGCDGVGEIGAAAHKSKRGAIIYAGPAQELPQKSLVDATRARCYWCAGVLLLVVLRENPVDLERGERRKGTVLCNVFKGGALENVALRMKRSNESDVLGHIRVCGVEVADEAEHWGEASAASNHDNAAKGGGHELPTHVKSAQRTRDGECVMDGEREQLRGELAVWVHFDEKIKVLAGAGNGCVGAQERRGRLGRFDDDVATGGHEAPTRRQTDKQRVVRCLSLLNNFHVLVSTASVTWERTNSVCAQP